MSGRDSDESGKKPISPELSAKFKRALDKLRPTLPIEEGKFTPNLRQVRMRHLQEGAEKDGEGEFARFVAGDPSKFSTYGMTTEEKKAATLTYNAEQDCLVDSEGKKATSGKFLYNVTREGDLVVAPALTGDFNHSSITRDGAIICAGYLKIKEGKINYIDTSSGHYTPEDLDLYNAIKILQKQSPKIFAESLEVDSFESGVIKSLSEFITFMEEPIQYESSKIPRVDVLREKRKSDNAKISQTGEKITFGKADSLEELILSTDISNILKEDKQYLFNFPKELFEPEYVSRYAKKTFGIENQEDKLKSLSLTSSELLTYLMKDQDKNIDTINHLINNGISRDKNFQSILPQISEGSVIDGSLKKYCMENGSKSSTEILYEIDTYSKKGEGKPSEIANHLLKPENFEQTFSMIEGFPMCNLILSASPEIQDQVIDKLMGDKDKVNSQEILSELSKNENISKEKRVQIIKDVFITPKLTKLLQNSSDAGSMGEKDREEFDAIKKDTVRLGELLGDKEKAVFSKHIGGIIREETSKSGVKMRIKRTLKQHVSDFAHSLGYKRQERDLVKTMIGLSNSETSKPLPSPVNKGSRGRRVF